MKTRAANVLKPLAVTAALIGLWAAASTSGVFSAYVLPGPGKVFVAFVKLAQSGALFEDVLVSLTRVFKGYSIAFLLAFALGALSSLAPKAQSWYDPLLNFLRNVPPIALIALLILWFGIGETGKIIIIVLAAFFPMLLGIRKGFLCCDPRLIEVGRASDFSPARRFFRIVLPSAVPDILVGMRIGLGYGWRAIIGAEMFAASSGLGHLIHNAQQMSRSDRVIVGILMIGLVGALTDWVFRTLIARLPYGGNHETD